MASPDFLNSSVKIGQVRALVAELRVDGGVEFVRNHLADFESLRSYSEALRSSRSWLASEIGADNSMSSADLAEDIEFDAVSEDFL